MNAKIKGKSELSKLLSIKTRISDEPNFVACPSGHYRLSSSGLPRFRLIWALFRSVVPLVAVERAHGDFSARSLLRSASRCFLPAAAFFDRLCA